MKTFLLKRLELLESEDHDITLLEIPLIDGLIINKEDDQENWIIEAYIDQSYQSVFKQFIDNEERVMVQVKITKESNAPATFITSISDVNEIGDNINVLFVGTIIDRQKGKVNNLLRKLVEEGYQGQSLIDKFKALI